MHNRTSTATSQNLSTNQEKAQPTHYFSLSQDEIQLDNEQLH